MKNVLSIAGTDPSGAAGNQVDLQVVRDFGHHGLSCITAVIAQNTSGIQDWVAVEPQLVARQLDSVFTDIRVDAVKVGMVPTAAVADAIADALAGRKLPVVIDPVLASGDGATALVREGTTEAILNRLFPLATVVTPNLLEARVLTGRSVDDPAGLADLAADMADITPGAVVLKAGHAQPEPMVVDLLVYQGETHRLAPHPRIAEDVRGTGCQLSTAIASGLAAGEDVYTSTETARTYLASHLQERRGRLGKGRPVVLRGKP